MATILCDNPQRLTIALFGQRLTFSVIGESQVQCMARIRPFPDIVEDQQAWIDAVQRGIDWFAAASPRGQLDAAPVFSQHIRLSEGPPGTLNCRAVHDGVERATEDPDEMSAVLDRVKAWFATAGVEPSP